MAKLHELQEKRRNIAAQMRQLNDEIGEKTWTEEQRTKWDSMKSELGGVESQIEREDYDQPMLYLLKSNVKLKLNQNQLLM